jgi:hypothetical protein
VSDGFRPEARPARTLGLVLVVLSCAAAGACTGDFGRPRASVWNDVILPQAGFQAASYRGEAASPFRMTDDEEQLRDRAWRFVMPAHERNYFEREVSALAYARILPVAAQSSDFGLFRGPDQRLLRLAGLALQSARRGYQCRPPADRPFRGNAFRVVAADRVRMRTVDGSPLVPPEKQRTGLRARRRE